MRHFKSHASTYVEFENEAQEAFFAEKTNFVRNPAEVSNEFEELLNSKPSEQKIQDFFESNPRYLPNAGFYHNGVRGSVVISKLPLHNDFITDFAYMSENSQTILVVCLEIERPDKKIFRRDGHFTVDFHQARQQIVDWNYWAQHNRREALKYFGKLSLGTNAQWMDVTLQSILVYGRRSEIDSRKRQERWSAEAALLPKSVQIMTYDRLLEAMKNDFRHPDNHKFIVCSYQERTLKAKYVRT